SALDGMQPTLRQVPPSPPPLPPCSASTTSRPSWPARIAVTEPPGPPPTTRTLALMSAISRLYENRRRRLEQAFYALHELGGVVAVDHAMIERRGEVHHGARHELRA